MCESRFRYCKFYLMIKGIYMALPVTAIVTAFNRADQTIETLKKIHACEPPPDEVIVHVDGANTALGTQISNIFPLVKVIVSQSNIGPGGGRNILLAAARNELVASFDDDSYPLDLDFFLRLVRMWEIYPDAAVISVRYFERGDEIQMAGQDVIQVVDFTGGACCYRKSAFFLTKGYISRAVAYGVEESDLALQLFEKNCVVLFTNYLRIYHDTDLKHRQSIGISLCVLENIFILAYLRMPIVVYPLILWKAIKYSYNAFNFRDIGIVMRRIAGLPRLLSNFSQQRAPLSVLVYVRYVLARRHPSVLGSIIP